MNEVGDDCRKLLAEVKKRLGFPGEKELREEPRYYADSLALCLIDSVQSLRNDYVGVVTPVVNRYISHRSERGGNASTDGLRDFSPRWMRWVVSRGGLRRLAPPTRHRAHRYSRAKQ